MLANPQMQLIERAWQPKSVERIFQSIIGGKVVLYDAPTGSGKSFVALSVASKLLEKRFVDRVYIAVRTHSEFSAFTRDAAKFFGNQLDYTYLLGKRASCPFYREGDDADDALCQSCLTQLTLTGKARMQADWMKARNMIKLGMSLHDMQSLYVEQEPVYPENLCLHWSLKQYSMQAQFALITYPYLLSTAPRKSIELDKWIETSAIILDEAHNMDEATSLFEKRLSVKMLLQMKEATQKLKSSTLFYAKLIEIDHVIRGLERLSVIIMDLTRAQGEARVRHRDKNLFLGKLDNELNSDLAEIAGIQRKINLIRNEEISHGRKPSLFDPYTRLAEFLEAFKSPSIELFTDAEDSLILKVVDPAEILRYLNKPKALLMMSGTLPSPEYVRNVWAIQRPVEYIRVDQDYASDYYAVFPRDAKQFRVAEEATTKFTERSDATWPKYAAIVKDAYLRASKNVLVCLPSYPLAKKVAECLKGSRMPYIVEERDTSHDEVLCLLKKPGAQYVLFAVARGKLMEGVEFTEGENGSSLIDTIVVAGIPFPVPDEYYKRKVEKIMQRLKISKESKSYGYYEFEFFTRQPALTVVRQAIGRAVRSPADRARVILADKRFRDGFWRKGLGFDR